MNDAINCTDVLPVKLIEKARLMYHRQGPWATTRWLKNQGFSPEEALEILHGKNTAEIEFDLEMKLACKIDRK